MPAVVPFETAAEMFHGLAARYAGTGKAALGFKDRQTKAWTDVSWDDLAGQVRALAGWLASVGVTAGDRVALLSENRPEWAAADLAVQVLGAVTVAVYPSLPAAQVAFIVRDSGARVLIASTGLQVRKAQTCLAECPGLERVLALAPPRDGADARVTLWADALAHGEAHAADLSGAAVGPESLSALIYTSGTTGQPKGVEMTQRNLISNVHAVHARIFVVEDDTHLSFLPLSHAFERTCGYTTVLSAGARIVYAESVDTVAKNLPEVRPTLLVSVPRVFEKVHAAVLKGVRDSSAVQQAVFAWAVRVGSEAAAKEKAGRPVGPVLGAQRALAGRLVFAKLHEKLGGRVRLAVSGGAALPKAIGEFFEAAGLPIVEGYGLSETAPILTANPPAAPVFGTVGHVFPGITVAIRDLHTGHLIGTQRGDDYPSELTTGAGEILARGPNVMGGYWNRPEESAAAFDAEGWFRTGDVGRFEGGYLRITDRIKSMIVSKGGKNIYPAPIEEALAASPLVEQVLVVGEGREFLAALVVAEPGALREAAGDAAWAAGDDDAVRAAPEALDLVRGVLAAYSKEAASHEKVRDARLVAEPFSVENDLLTPTMKPRRPAIEARYADLVAEMYAGGE